MDAVGTAVVVVDVAAPELQAAATTTTTPRASAAHREVDGAANNRVFDSTGSIPFRPHPPTGRVMPVRGRSPSPRPPAVGPDTSSALSYDRTEGSVHDRLPYPKVKS